MEHNRITIDDRVYQGNQITDGNCFIGNSLPGDELAVDTLTATISEKNEDLTTLPYGTPVFYYHDGVLVGKFYSKKPKRVGRTSYELSCVSAVGLLGGVDHFGGLYAGTLAGDVLKDIIGGVVEYEIDKRLEIVPVYGWLPKASRRDNLRQLLFAIGGSLKKNTAGVIHVTTLSSGSPVSISNDRLGYDGTVDPGTPATGVEVTEHAFFVSGTDETVTLHDGAVSMDSLTTPKGETVAGTLVTFSDPMHDLSVTNGTILESGVNYAVLGESSNTTLTGKKYTHTARIVYKAAEGVPSGTMENVVKVDEATLVSLANSGNVADRVLAYYSVARVVDVDMIFGAERPGDAVSFEDPFDEQSEGIIQSQDINMSNTLLAATEIAVGYVPPDSGNVYSNVVVLTESRTWMVPVGVKKIRTVLISGGTGGMGGTGGTGCVWTTGYAKDGAQIGPFDRDGIGGTGGESGPPGTGGKVLDINLDVVPGQEFSVHVGGGGTGGAGGAGGLNNYRGEASGTKGTHSKAGAPGGASLFGNYSSGDGSIFNDGYYEPLQDVVYAVSGNGGLVGGRGGGTYGGSKQAESLYGQVGGAPGMALSGSGYTAQGGGGGGCAFGADGHAATAATYYGKISFSGTSYSVYNVGAGGDGAKAIKAESGAVYGSGGQGGHGGGGAGNFGAGVGSGSDAVGVFKNNTSVNANANGGDGGDGGDGAPGCVIIYY